MVDSIFQRFVGLQRAPRSQSGARHALAARLQASLGKETRRFVEESLAHGNEFGVLAISIERLDTLCETFGPAVTQALEQQLIERLEGLSETGLLILTGLEGEMLMLVPGVDGLSGQRFMERLLDRLTQALELPSITIAPSVVIGAAYSPVHGSDASTLIRRARIALTTARDSFMPAACFESGRDKTWARHLELIGELRQALVRDEIELHFQPKVCAGSGEVCGAEALVRWRHPERGLVPPGEFIPLAETCGVIVALGDHVLKLAIAQLARWQLSGLRMDLAVNLCARDIEDATLIKRVNAYLAQAQVPAQRLIVEVTESAVMLDTERARAVLNELRAMGIRISLDDFGTGHSSLAKLCDMPVDELKVDRAFITDIKPGSIEATIVEAVMVIGHAAGCTVVAEGVETEAERDLITRLGADLVQGWVVAQAMPIETFDQWLLAEGRPLHPAVRPTLRRVA